MITLIVALTPAIISLIVVLGISHFVDRYYNAQKPSHRCAHEWVEKDFQPVYNGGDFEGLNCVKHLYCCKKCGAFTQQKIDDK